MSVAGEPGAGARGKAQDIAEGGGTRERILDAAELLFAEQGFGVPTRAICQHAGINQGLIHYYFGSKSRLFEEVIGRRAARIVERRDALLAAALQEAPPRLRPILHAFVAPPLTLAAESPGASAFTRILSRIHQDPDPEIRAVIARLFDLSTGRFAAAVKRVLPDLDERTIYWRLSFVIGIYQYTLSGSGRLEAISGNRCRSDDTDTAIAQIVAFLEAGFAAPPPAALG